jgi:magnesium chelatase subunit I
MSTVKSLNALLDLASSRRFLDAPPSEGLGLAEHLPFPFLALVGQSEMKLALLLALINPNVGGVLLVGPRGTGKTTAARSLTDLTPFVQRSLCNYGCLPEDVEAGGIDAVCPDCAEKFGNDDPLTIEDRVALIELPLNARLDDVIGGIDQRAAVHRRQRLQRGILARADHNLLYVDEVNLLSDEIVDAILDAAAQGTFTVRRGPHSATYWARFGLIGSMNPEEGNLRPQILDRFGLRVLVRGLDDPQRRLEAYRRTIAFRRNPHRVIEHYWDATERAREELQATRDALPDVGLTRQAENYGLKLIEEMGIDSLRAEITLFEAARAYAVADGREKASAGDIRLVASMSLRLRRSTFMKGFSQAQAEEQEELEQIMHSIGQGGKKRRKQRKST